MATIKLVAGATVNWTSLVTTDLNSLTTNQAIMGGLSIDNGTNNDLAAEFSFVGGGSITPTGSPYLGLFLYPQNGDNSTYGDGRFSTAAVGPPPSNYYRGFCGFPSSAATQTGVFAIPGTSIFRLPLPRGVWKPVIYNFTGVTLTSTGNIVYYRTTNLSVT